MKQNKIIEFIKVVSAASLIIFSSIIFLYHLSLGTFELVNPDKNIVLVALPKSGSTYLMTTLQENLGYTRLSQFMDVRSAPSGPATYAADNKAIKPKIFIGTLETFFQKESTIIRDHYRAPSVTAEKQFGSPVLEVDNIKKHTHKIILHLRDPRQALLSYIHHLNKNKGATFALPDLSATPYDLSEYYTLNLSGQIDWAIENVLPHMIIWINDWLIFKQKEDQSPNGLKILVTTYDELIQDEMALYRKIAAFYGLPFHDAQFKKIAKNAGVRFRKGDPNEWKTVFTAAQKKRVSEIVPISLLHRFHWE